METKTQTLNNANIKRIVTKTSCLLVFLFVLFGVWSQTAEAATLYFSPSSGTYAVGATFSVNIYVSSADQAMNAASGIIAFPRDKLEVVSLSKTGSIFSLWVQEPSFSNSAGTVNFEGIVLNPGFTGSSGKAITLTFKTMVIGNAPLIFSSGSVLANDGKGTNILTGMGDANFSIGGVGSGASETITPVEIIGTPTAPEISSLTHPDPNKWYALKNIKFIWELSSDITGARLFATRIPNIIPITTYIPPINSKEIMDLADGIWYFSVRLRNNVGWGAISSFRFQIDTEKPRFEITEISRADLTEPKAKFIFDANDKTSGIDHYEVKIDNNDLLIWKDDGNHKYETPILESGKHTLIAKAVDRAGNTLANSAEFIIEALESPIITEYPKILLSGETLIVNGTTKYSNIQVIVWLQKENEEAKNQSVKSDDKGNFIFIVNKKLDGGIYKLWAEVTDERGAKSNPSDKIIISIERPAFLKIGSWAVSLLAIVVPLIALIIALLFMLWYGWHKFSMFRKKFKKEVIKAEQTLHLTFDRLRIDIKEQIKMFEETRIKRQLTEEEEKILKKFKNYIDEAEKFIKKEIEDIEKEVK